MAKEFSKKFYASKQWKQTRAAYLASKYYVCERCKGVASIVHHRRYITPQNVNNPLVTLAWDNLEALCMDCHNNEHMGGDACADGLMFTEDGDISPRMR